MGDAGQLQTSWLSFLLKQLSHPVVKKNQQLTDRMLKLLSNISKNIKAPTRNTVTARTVTPPTGVPSPEEPGTSTSGASSAVATQQTPQQPASNVATQATSSGGVTMTMSAQASTSNTQTESRGNTATETSTTTSSKSMRPHTSSQQEEPPNKQLLLR